MPMEAKISLINKTEKALSSQVTADNMDTMLRTLADTLQEFDVYEIKQQTADTVDLLKCYLDALKVEGRSPGTIEKYRYNVGRLLNDLQVPVRQITVYHIREWLTKEQNRGLSACTLDGDRQDFSAFFGWLHREGLIERNPMGSIRKIKGEKKKKKIITSSEMERLNDNTQEMKYSVRNRAIVEFLRATGCRISEVLKLNREEVHLNTMEVVVMGKGSKERIVYLDEVAVMYLKQYLESRTDDDPALFLGQRGERLKAGGVRAMLNKLAEKSNVEHVHPHKFRRTLATNLNRRGMPIQEVANLLGHEKLDTTMKYVVLNDEDLKHDYRKYTV